VDVGSRALDGVGDEQVHQLDDGRFLAGALKLVHIHLFLFFLDLEVEFVLLLLNGELVIHLLQLDGVRRAVVFLDRPGDGALRGDHRLDIEARHELDVVHGEHVGRVRHRDRQRGARAAERENLVLLRGLGGNKLDDRLVDLEGRQVDGRNVVLTAEEADDLVVGDVPELHEVHPELAPVRLLVVQGLLELLRGDPLLLQQEFANPDRHLAAAPLRPLRPSRSPQRRRSVAFPTRPCSEGGDPQCS